jgi:hypothetical protein
MFCLRRRFGQKQEWKEEAGHVDLQGKSTAKEEARSTFLTRVMPVFSRSGTRERLQPWT